jgi:DNA-binding CsgD family transcriptional regulator
MDFHQESLENTPVSSRRKTESSEDCRQENSPRDYPSSLLIVTLSNVFPPELLQGDTESLRHKLCFNLTAREKTLFALLASGSSAKSVANKLNLSRSAATTAKSRLITKLRKRLKLIRSDYEYDYQAV